MSIFDKVFGRSKDKKSTLVLSSGWKRYLSWIPGMGMSEVVEDFYKGNATVFACMTVLANMFPEPELWAWERGEQRNEYKPLQKHALRSLMRKPNADMGEAELMQFVITYAPLGGNVYLWKDRQVNGKVKALYPLHDGQMQPVAGRKTSEGMVAYYVMDAGKIYEKNNPYRVDRFDNLQGIAVPKSDVVHWKWMIDPQNPARGIGALVASAGDANLAQEARNYVYSFLKNDGTPPLVVNMEEGDEGDKNTIERLKKEWVKSYGGKNKGVPAFLTAGMKVTQLGSNLSDLDTSSLRDGPDAAICMGFHIHPAVVGAIVGLKHSTYSNYSEASKALAEQTLIPLWRSFASEIEQSMAGEIGYASDVTIRFDLSQVSALSETEDAKEVRLGRALDRGGITRAEYRRGIGFDADKADDVYKETLAVIWTARGQLRETDPDMLAGKNAPLSAKADIPPNSPQGRASDLGGEAQKTVAALGQSLRKIRGRLAPAVEAQLKVYFGQLAEGIVEAVERREKAAPLSLRDTPPNSPQVRASDLGGGERKGLAEEVFAEVDGGDLERLLKGFYVTVMDASWETWNVALGVQVAFDMTDPTVTKILAGAGARAKDINATTLQALRDALQYASDEGWGIDQLVRGDAEAGVRGLREIVDETYSGRARTIARTELGEAQNLASVSRYEEAGVDKVLILDNGKDDDDEACAIANGQVWSVAYFKSHSLEHPNCTRAGAPYFGERAVDRG